MPKARGVPMRMVWDRRDGAVCALERGCFACQWVGWGAGGCQIGRSPAVIDCQQSLGFRGVGMAVWEEVGMMRTWMRCTLFWH